jgi:hypothetical protein
MISFKSLVGLLLCGVLMAPAGFAGGPTKLLVKYAGSGYDVSDKDAYGMAINILLTDTMGTFGDSTTSILSEFAPDMDDSVSCPSEYPLAFDLVRCMTTMTTAKLDMLYGVFTDGWLCMSLDQYEWIGEANGVYFDGTGRFKDATGTWSTEYLGNNLDADAGYRTITGTITGSLNLQ